MAIVIILSEAEYNKLLEKSSNEHIRRTAKVWARRALARSLSELENNHKGRNLTEFRQKLRQLLRDF